MALTYELIATTALGSSNANMTLSSIPATYTNLIVTGNFKASNPGNVVFVYFNGDTGGTGYYFQELGNTGSTITANHRSDNNGWITWHYGYVNNFSNSFHMEIPQYRNTSQARVAYVRSGNTAMNEMMVCRVASTTAISSITLTAGGGTFDAGSQFSIWGVLKA